MIRSGTHQIRIREIGGKNFVRTFDVGRNIGTDVTTGNPTSIMTIVTRPSGNSNDLLKHAYDNTMPPSNYVSTSRSADVASQFGDNVYVIRNRRNGIDVNVTLGPQSPYPYELEIAMPDGIPYTDVRALMQSNQSLLNPNYKPD